MKKTLRRYIMLWSAGILFAAVSLTSCQKTNSEMDQTSAQMTEQMKQDIDFISSLGYDVADIEKADDGYLVEGDIWLTDQWLQDIRQEPQTRLNQHNRGYLVSPQYQNKLYLDINNLTTASALWSNPATNAMTQWNSLAKCYISIYNTSGSNRQEIKIKFENKSSFGNSTAKLMKVTPPSSDGKPGSVTLNADCTFLPDVNNLSSTKEQSNATYLIMHAIGHSLGLGHTLPAGSQPGDDEDWGTTIGGTSPYDGKSIMTREKSPIAWSGFSTDDKRYLPVAFPIPGFNAGSIEQSKTISQTTGTFSINSVSDASGGTGAITYAWEKRSDGNWVAVSSQTKKGLTNAPVPTELTSEYRRKAMNGTTTLYSNTCTVTNNMYQPLNAGSIPEMLTIETESPGGQITIISEQAAFCPRSAVTYTWEIKEGDSWTEILSATGASLTTAAPMTFTAAYRRKATCDHETAYSNVCTVYNKSFLTGGTIPELIELNKTGFNRLFIDIPFLSEPSLGDAGENPIRVPIPNQRITKFSHVTSTPFGPVYTNECTIINHADLEDPLQGTDSGNNILKLGPYNSDFTKVLAIDTRREYFRDIDRLRGCGNDVFIRLEITEKMYIEIKTASVPMGVFLDVWSETEHLFAGNASEPLIDIWFDAEYIPFPTFEDDIPGPMPDPDARSFYLTPGKYELMLQGAKKYNSGAVNEVISLSLRGTCMEHDPTVPIPTPQQ